MSDNSDSRRTEDDADAVVLQLRSFGATFQAAVDDAGQYRPIDRPWEGHVSSIPDPAARADVSIEIHSSEDEDEPEITMLEIDRPQDRGAHWARPELLVAAVVLLITGVAALSWFVSRDEVTIEALSQPEMVVASYVESFNAGDADAAMTLFAPDVEVTDRFVANRDEWEMLVHWYVAQGAQLTAPVCETTATVGNSTTIECSYQNRHAPHLAKDLPGVAIQSVFVIESGLITAFDHGFDSTGAIGQSFERWVGQNYPENANIIACCSWGDISEAEAAGQVIVQYAAEWATG